MEKYSRILGSIFGDVLGGTLEFFTHAEGKKKYGYLKDIIYGFDNISERWKDNILPNDNLIEIEEKIR